MVCSTDTTKKPRDAGRSDNATQRLQPLVSVVINGHNYGHFLKEAIESALEQSYARTEAVVVDDGSSDDSAAVMASFGNRIEALYAPHLGQAAAINRGVSSSKGDILLFLDADDRCAPDRAQRLVEWYSALRPGPAMVCHRLKRFGDLPDDIEIDPACFTNLERTPLSGDLFEICDAEAAYQHARSRGYIPYLSSPTSGISMNRALAVLLFPVPEAHAVGGDCAVTRGAMLTAPVYGSDAVLGWRRMHALNASQGTHPHPHLSDEKFLRSMQSYLNQLLIARGREPVISIFESWGALRLYRSTGSVRDLLRLAVAVPRREPSWSSLRFTGRALRFAAQAFLRR